MLPSLKRRFTGPPVEPVTAPEPPVPLPSPELLTQARVDALANALHERWHGEHTPERGKTECARQAGAFDDAATVIPLIESWLRDAEQSGRRVILAAAVEAERAQRIGTTQQRDVAPVDLAWFKAKPQTFYRTLRMRGVSCHELATWLRTLADRKTP